MIGDHYIKFDSSAQKVNMKIKNLKGDAKSKNTPKGKFCELTPLKKLEKLSIYVHNMPLDSEGEQVCIF